MSEAQQVGCHPGCYYYTDSCFRDDCKQSNEHRRSAPPAGYRWKGHQEHRDQVQPGRQCSSHLLLAGGQCGACLWHPNMLVKLPL